MRFYAEIAGRFAMIILGSIELFSLDVTAEALRVNVGSKSAISLQRVPVDPKFEQEIENYRKLYERSFSLVF